MTRDRRKTPFPYFGGKAGAAAAVWATLGDVPHYVEPFFGSGAVLFRRPHEPNRAYYSETVNDADGLLVNFWRALQLWPDELAEAASWPVSEADLHAWHLRLLCWRAENDLERLMGDPLFCDVQLAGWWVWSQSAWIGSGWCSGQGPWVLGEGGRITRRQSEGRKPGVKRYLRGGYGVANKQGHQQHRERLWISPHCLRPAQQQDKASTARRGSTGRPPLRKTTAAPQETP